MAKNNNETKSEDNVLAENISQTGQYGQNTWGNQKNRISFSNKNADNDEDSNDELKFNDDPRPMEYASPFPIDKIIVGGAIVVIVGLIALIAFRNIFISDRQMVRQSSEDTQDPSEETISSKAIYSITDENALISSSNLKTDDVVIKNLNSITCWGDEYLSGSLTNDLSIPTYIARDIKGRYDVFNAGCYNEDLTGIAERQGGVYIEIMPAIIPSDPMEVPVELKNMYGEDCNIHISGERNGGLNPVVINGVEGTLTATGHGYTFKRSTRGDELKIVHPTVVRTKGSIDRANDIQVIFIGKNQDYSIDRTLNMYKSMVDFINPLVKPYVIVGIAEGSEDSQKELEARMTAEFGRHYINIREYLSKYAMSELGKTPTNEDSASMAEGRVPASLMENDSQFTAETNEIVAKLIRERFAELNIM